MPKLRFGQFAEHDIYRLHSLKSTQINRERLWTGQSFLNNGYANSLICLKSSPLTFDDQGVCGLAFDDRWYITLIDDAESECWRIYGSWWDEKDQELDAKTVRDLFRYSS